ncbi:hypothetical protein PUNSTDRAFT_67508 [Punctularia strigosozonata HHB-11173 SS5]|uniref:uncharacterized protein n=1 Tax=Punctularia strigosozonata (strain HHB-11173) TaxID=741275 RepID=UPI00044176B8|nr:uncharacterized protein PUNSTDRAFT_67508 [Punctularia strigosozonata HHB-11173 SS5]EIN08729.1 hypothetical protein PUNSTDRAFT_67508 [Punctularia strigosozonata HHB-11173 SS5]
MTRRDHLSSTRFDQLREIVKRITRVANILVPDDMGVHLRFINHPRVYDHLNTAQTENAMRLVYPTSGTPSGTVLETRILRPLVYNLLDNPRGPQLRRPLLICTITDGAPTDGDAFKKAILKCRRRIVAAGYAPKTVMFSISHIGQDRHAAQFIQSLRSDGEIKDVIYCTSDSIDGKFYELRDNERGLEVWLLELLTNGLN